GQAIGHPIAHGIKLTVGERVRLPKQGRFVWEKTAAPLDAVRDIHRGPPCRLYSLRMRGLTAGFLPAQFQHQLLYPKIGEATTDPLDVSSVWGANIIAHPDREANLFC